MVTPNGSPGVDCIKRTPGPGGTARRERLVLHAEQAISALAVALGLAIKIASLNACVSNGFGRSGVTHDAGDRPRRIDLDRRRRAEEQHALVPFRRRFARGIERAMGP